MGKTWTKIDFLFSNPQSDPHYDGANFGAAVYDKITDEVFVQFFVGAHTKQDMAKHYLIKSADRGLTWEAPFSIDGIFSNTDIGVFAGGPASGIQLEERAGISRLIMSGHTNKRPTGPPEDSGVAVIYSDDHGLNWNVGGGILYAGEMGPDECQLAQLSDGRLIMNMRDRNNEKSDCHCRLQAYSNDDGNSWGDMSYATDLIEPRCQGSIINDSSENTLYFSNPRSTKSRRNGWLMKSTDNGNNYEEVIQIDEKDYGYSEINLLPDGKILVIYESTTACNIKQFFSSMVFQCWIQGYARILPSKFISNSIRIATIDTVEDTVMEN